MTHDLCLPTNTALPHDGVSTHAPNPFNKRVINLPCRNGELAKGGDSPLILLILTLHKRTSENHSPLTLIGGV